MKPIVDRIGKPAMLEQTAEECAELAHACLKGSETMKRLTSITPEGILFLNASLEKYADADREAIVRLGKIENILGDDYDLDHLEKLVEADKRGADIVYRSAWQAAQRIERVFEDVVDSFNAAQGDVEQAKKELAKEVLMGGDRK